MFQSAKQKIQSAYNSAKNAASGAKRAAVTAKNVVRDFAGDAMQYGATWGVVFGEMTRAYRDRNADSLSISPEFY